MLTYKIIGFIVLVCFMNKLTAQEENMQTEDSTEIQEIFYPVEIMPIFQGGDMALICYIENQLDYDLLNSIDTTGRCFYSFIIDSVGQSHYSKVHRPINERLDLEMKRILDSLPLWTPGEVTGKKVSVNFTIPMNLPYIKRCSQIYSTKGH